MSIKANELRIGNLVYYGESIRVITQIGVSPQRNFVGVDNMITTFDVISPIPLTPEILEKAGFVKELILGRKDKYWYRLGELSYNESHEAFWFHGILKYQPKSLHQLQNLYFALTGEELIVKF